MQVRNVKGKPIEKWGGKAKGANGFAEDANANVSQLPNATETSVY